MIIKPRKLKRGDVIGIIAPSGGLSALVPHRLDAAKKNLEKLGFKVRLFPTTRMNFEGKAGTKKQRIKDIHDAFKDSNVKAIMCAIGGLSNNEIIPSLNYELIRKNPKIFIGYSDNTLLHYAFQKKAGILTFYGPCAITQFGEYPDVLKYTKESFIKILIDIEYPIRIKPSDAWTDEILDWFEKKNRERSRKLKKNEGYTWLRKGKAKGKIVGGCLYSILQLVGTDYDLDYSDKILFIELPEGQDFMRGEPIEYVESQILDLKNKGILKKIKGLIVGRPYKYIKEDEKRFKKALIESTAEYGFPILYGVDIGHTDPMMTLPLGVDITMDSENDFFRIDEAYLEQ